MYEIEEFLQAEHIILFNYHVLKRKTYPSSLKNVTIDSFGWANFAKLWIQPSPLTYKKPLAKRGFLIILHSHYFAKLSASCFSLHINVIARPTIKTTPENAYG